MAPNNYSVYAAVNKALGEAVIGVSDSVELEAIRQSHSTAAPSPISRWPAEHPVDYKILESGLGIREALLAAKKHASSAAFKKLKVRVVG